MQGRGAGHLREKRPFGVENHSLNVCADASYFLTDEFLVFLRSHRQPLWRRRRRRYPGNR